MSDVLFVAVAVASAFWVYFDATGNKIGKIPGAAGMFNLPAGGWAAVTLLFWIWAAEEVIATAERIPRKQAAEALARGCQLYMVYTSTSTLRHRGSGCL